MSYIETSLGREEQIVFHTRQHLVVILWQVFIYSIGLMVIGVATLFLFQWLADTSYQEFSLLMLVLALPVLLRFLLDFLDWWSREYVVTNRRVIQTEGIFSKRVSDSSLEKVNDVVLEQSFLGRLLNYGDLEIITGSDIGVNVMNRIAKPVEFKTVMLNQKEELHERNTMQAQVRHALNAENPAQAMDIPALLANLADLRDRGVISQEEFERKKAQLLERI